MKSDSKIREKIAEHQKCIDEMMSRPTDERDDSFWIDLQKLRGGQRALVWAVSGEDYLQMDDIDKLLEWESVCRDASKIF